MASDSNGNERRASILSAAEMVFGECGYSATTMEAVAEKAGISKGSIYNYFQSKEELFKHVFLCSFQDAEDRSQTIMESSQPVSQKIHALVDFWFERLTDHKHIGQLLLEFWATAARQDGAGDLAKMLKELIGSLRDRLAGVLTKGVDSGEFGSMNPQVAAWLIMAILHGIEVQVILNIGLAIDSEFVNALKGAILAALKAGPGSPNLPVGES
jgi:AcrR family transcriptional regulator